MSIKCSECENTLTEETKKCPKCGSTKRTIMIVVKDTIGISESLGLKKKSGKKDDRGKLLKEERIRVKGKTENIITIDRSKRLNGNKETDVFHEVKKSGKTIHGPHLEPKGKNKKKKQIIKKAQTHKTHIR